MRLPLVLALLAALLTGASAQPPTAGPLADKTILIFSHSTGFRHDSIEPGAEALAGMIARAGGEAVTSEDPDLFSAAGLERFDAILLLSTTTDARRPQTEWLTGPRRTALREFLRRGGGVVGVHAASDSHAHWPWYGEMLGGRFRHHPAGTPRGRLRVVDPDHPATKGLAAEIEHVDEWYLIAGYDPDARLLVTLDPASIGETGGPVPISWAREQEGGRVFYTSLGHRTETYALPFFQAHVLGGLAWVTTRSGRRAPASPE